MNADERALIDGLFDRLRAVADAPRDAEADALIARHVAEQPYAPYALTQTVLVQEHALQAASARIEELEAELKAREAQPAPAGAGSFLGGLLGGSPAGRGTSVPSAGQRPDRFGYPDAPAGQNAAQAGNQPMAPAQAGGPMRGAFGGGGGFLSSALTTAAGVAGGALLFEGIRSMLNSSGSPFGEAKAAEAKPEAGADAATDSGTDSGSSWNPWGDSAKSDAGAEAKDAGADAAPATDADTGIDDGFFSDLAADDGDGLDGGFSDDNWA